MYWSLERIRSTATFGLAVLFLLNVFLQSTLLDGINLVVLIIVLVLSLLAVQGTSRLVGYFLLATGIFLLIIYKAPLEEWVTAATRNLYLVVMFTLVPLLGTPIRQGDYMEALRGVFKRYVKTDSHFYLFLSIFSSFVTMMVNIASIPLLYQISLASEKSKQQRLLSSALSRGVASAVIWSPSAASVGLIMELTGANWVTFFPYALIIAILSGLTGWSLSRIDHRWYKDKIWNEDSPTQSLVSSEELNWNKVLELGFFGLILIVSIIVISVLTGINTIKIVALASLAYPIIWLGAIKKLSGFWLEFKGIYFREGLPKLRNEVTLFIGAGFLASGVSYSHLGDFVPQLLNAVVGQNDVLFSMAVILFIALFSVIGIHPIITVTVIATTVNPEGYGISSTVLALLLTTAWSMGTAMSPTAANVIAMAGLINHSPLDVGPRWNWPYVAVFSVVAVSIISLMRMLGLLH